MYTAGMLLAFVATMRVVLGALLFVSVEHPARALVPLAAVLTGATYLVWLRVRGRRQLRQDAVPQSARNAVVAYGLISLVLLPAADWLVLQTLV